MELYSGLDLHSTNTYIGILDTDFKRIFKKRISNNLDLILETLEPFKDQLKGLVVESTYNWYWLVTLQKTILFCDGQVFSIDRGLLMGAYI